MTKQKKKVVLLPLVKYKDKFARFMYKSTKGTFIYNVLYGGTWKQRISLVDLNIETI